MSHYRRRWEEAGSSQREPGYRRHYSDEYDRRRRPTEVYPRSSFNYWRDDDSVAPTSRQSRGQRSYAWEDYGDGRNWNGSSRSQWHAESSGSTRRRRDFGGTTTGREWGHGDRQRSWRDAHHSPPRQRRSTYTSPPTTNIPPEPIPSLPKPAPPERPRKASPLPLTPSPAYLSVSQQPSTMLSDPVVARKLLVLDLNGTLLFRSGRFRGSSGPHLRPVQPRPYMPTFRQYLFCPETKAWLDTMVWSSAQPHSVDDMVDKVFGTSKGELKAVWNRKCFGLSEVDYHHKAITTKDLAKAWDLFASVVDPGRPEGQPAVPLQSPTVHSALTTLLLDDSPQKVVLQPYSHVCLPEYDNTKRQHDLRSFLATKEPKQSKKAKRRSQMDVVPALSVDQPLKGAHPAQAENESYDATLLAIIGILETAKLQSNVAGWIHKGGLWAGEEDDTLGVKHHIVKTILSTVAHTGNDVGSTTSDPEQAPLQTRMWFHDPSVVAFWVARGRRTLIELGIEIVHGITGSSTLDTDH